jgi:hypothetical protein
MKQARDAVIVLSYSQRHFAIVGIFIRLFHHSFFVLGVLDQYNYDCAESAGPGTNIT